MQNLLVFFTTMLTALAIENAVFARGLGLSRATMFMNSLRGGILLGGAFTWMAVFSSLLVALTNYVLLDNPYISIIRPICYLFGVFVVYVLTLHLASSYQKGKYYPQVAVMLPLSTFNTALFGAFYISASQSFSFFQTTGYALGAGIGYTAAVLVIYFARKRLAISPVPRSFRGLPILLIYLGLLSLALYGLIGHNLPT